MRSIDRPKAAGLKFSRAGALHWTFALCLCMACQTGDPIASSAPTAAGAAAPVPVATLSGPVAELTPSMDPALAPASTQAALDVVAAHGVRGELAPPSFLSDAGDGRRNLILLDWEIPADSEQYLCGRVTATEEVYLKGFYALSPAGTHHTSVTALDEPDGPDGVVECDVTEVGTRHVAGSGAGTMGRSLPPGVAIKVERGSQLLLNLHLFNFTDGPLRGRSGTVVETTPPESVTMLAGAVAVGPIKLTIPPGRSVQTGVCTVDRDYTIFGILPHMHQMGAHMKVVARSTARGDVVVHDGPYDFEHQNAYNFDPLALAKGDTILVECTYDNTTGQTLHWGESTTDEMCLAGVAKYPAAGAVACPF